MLILLELRQLKAMIIKLEKVEQSNLSTLLYNQEQQGSHIKIQISLGLKEIVSSFSNQQWHQNNREKDIKIHLQDLMF